LEFTIKRIGARDPSLVEAMLDLFADVFVDPDYSSKRPTLSYIDRLLRSETFVALVALNHDGVVGSLAAYELIKFEQERSEYYIYDLAVREEYRRRGVATQLIMALKPIAASRGAEVMFVQADHGDDPAIALYTKLGQREDVVHFDISTD
jgi:aminoglycoside 3-N-acetyltransferase I